MQEAKRQRVADLLRAHVTYTEITRITGASSATISAVEKRLETGKDLKKAPRTPGQSGKAKKLTDAFLETLEDWFEVNPTHSIRKTAKEMGVSERTIRRGLKSLDMVSKVRPTRPLLTKKTIETRLFKAKRLLNQIKKQKSDTVRIFSDKKIFTVDQAHNRRNDRWINSFIESSELLF